MFHIDLLTTHGTQINVNMEYNCVFVIVGGGIAGVSCAEVLSIINTNDPVILVTASQTVKVANNVLQLTKTLTQFDVVEKDANLLSQQYPNVTVLHDLALSVDPRCQILHTHAGRTIKYKRLCLCTGGEPKIIEYNSPYVIGIRDVDSVSELARRVASARCMMIVGNGGIATEMMYEVCGVKKIWVVKDNHISSTFVDAGAAQFFQNCLLKNDNEVHRQSKRMRYTVTGRDDSVGTGPALGPDWHANVPLQGIGADAVTIEYECHITNITMLTNEEFPIRVCLSNGKSYDCDFVVSATGVIPNSNVIDVKSEELLLADDGGIKVDWKLETNVKNIYAAGDVCTAAWEVAHQWHQMRLWTQARQMGMYAAQSMSTSLTDKILLQDFCFELFSHVTKFFGFKVVLLGLFNGQKLNNEYEILLRVTKNVEYIKLIVKNGKIQGAILIGDTDLEEVCENLILNQLDVSDYGEDLLNPDIDIEDYFD